MTDMKQAQTKNREISIFLLDALLTFFSYMIASEIWGVVIRREDYLWTPKFYRLFLVIIMAFGFATLFSTAKKKIFFRSRVEELFRTIQMNFFTLLFAAFIIFAFGVGEIYSRGTLGFTIVINVILTYFVHQFIKSILTRISKNSPTTCHVMLITTTDRIDEILENARKKCDWNQRITSIALVDGTEDLIGTKYQDIPIVATNSGIIEAARARVVDAVFLFVPYNRGTTTKVYVEEFEQMGVEVHLFLQIMQNFEGANHVLSTFAGYPVVTFSQKFFSLPALVVKRIMDICGALVGLVFVLLAVLFIGIPLKLESKGPLFFKQKRVGKNGRFFTIYKFRSMYSDAEERKKELMAKNEMQGAMFKMTDDPRITKVGKFIRKTSIDELPQFINVLLGDMSLVGTRPPTVEEFNEYSPYHKRRLCMKPGLSGMWQVSGRSNITDFEEVVRLDLEYIDNWSLALDIKIILKTFLVVFKKDGSR